MSTNENTLEDKIFAIALLSLCIGFGYMTKSQEIIALFFRDLGIPSAFALADGLIQIVTISTIVLTLIGVVLKHLDRTEK